MEVLDVIEEMEEIEVLEEMEVIEAIEQIKVAVSCIKGRKESDF